MFNTDTDDFKFHVPITVVKGGEEGSEMILGGIASTGDKDREGENIIPSGLDYKYLVESGYINWHHQVAKDPAAVIGEPIKAEIRKDGLYIEGMLYKDSEMARKAYGLAQVLSKNTKRRKLGWSIEGKVLERDPANPGRVTKARVTGVALTPMPINPNTFVNIIKGMADVDKVLEHSKDFTPEEAPAGDGNGGTTKEININGQSVKIQKGEEDELVITIKAMSTSNARPVMPESVEGGTKPKGGAQAVGEDAEKVKDKDIQKGMDKEQVMEYLFANYPDMTIEKAKKVIATLKKNKAL